MEALTFKNIRVGHANAFLPSVWFLINAGIFSLFRLYLFDNGGLWMRVSKRPIVSSYKPRSKFPSFIHGQNNSIRRFYMNLISEVIAIKQASNATKIYFYPIASEFRCCLNLLNISARR